MRFLTELDPDTTVASLDGIGAFDHVQRAAFMERLLKEDSLHEIIPLVVALYGSDSRFLWRDAEGQEHTIVQGEGGEQGDPLMPALFALAQHEALLVAAGHLQQGERIFAFLYDL